MTKQKKQRKSTALQPPSKTQTLGHNKAQQSKAITINKLKDKIRSKIRRSTTSEQHQEGNVFFKPERGLVQMSQVTTLINPSQLNCPFCWEYCVFPVINHCGHYYCLDCFQSSLPKHQVCCICRADIDMEDYQPSAFFQNLFLKTIQENITSQQCERYRERVQIVRKREEMRKLPENLQIGARIVYMHNQIWLEAYITTILQEHLQFQFLDQITNVLKKVTLSKKSRFLAAYEFIFPPPIPRKESWQDWIQLQGDGHRYTEEVEPENRRDTNILLQ